jgi:hypothetical protein
MKKRRRASSALYGSLSRGVWHAMVNPELMFSYAQMYHEARLVSSDYAVKTRSFHLFIPATVLGAFAFELYLKTLIIIDTGRSAQNEHNYWRLFYQKLPSNTQREVKERYEKLPPDLLQHAHQHIEELKSTEYDTSFEGELKHSQDAFVLWRYLFEDAYKTRGGHRGASDRIRDALIQTICARRPTWKLNDCCKPRTSPYP